MAAVKLQTLLNGVRFAGELYADADRLGNRDKKVSSDELHQQFSRRHIDSFEARHALRDIHAMTERMRPTTGATVQALYKSLRKGVLEIAKADTGGGPPASRTLSPAEIDTLKPRLQELVRFTEIMKKRAAPKG